MNGLEIKDISDELLIINKHTIDNLFSLENCSDCISLYIFYYKTAKWQNNSNIKANDTYTKKCLKWGNERLKKTKHELKLKGLIDIVQRRVDNKIDGWYIKVNYFINEKKEEEIKVLIESNNSQKQELLKPTCCYQTTSTINNNISTINNNISTIEIIKNYDFSDKMTNSIKEWIEYKKEKKQAYKNIGFKKLLTEIKNNCNIYGEKKVIEVIDYSMARNYTGIVFNKLEQDKKNNKGGREEVIYETI